MDINDMLRRHSIEFVLLELRDQLVKETARADREAVARLEDAASHTNESNELRGELDRLRVEIQSLRSGTPGAKA